MSDEINTGSESEIQAPDPMKGLETKLNNTEKHLESLYATQKALVEAINNLNAPKHQQVEESSDSISDLIISNPDQAVKRIKESVKREINQDLSAQNEKQAEEQRVLNSLRQEFPEISDMNHSLTRTALEIYDRMTEREKSSPIAYKAAIQEAAMKTGIKPKSQRNQSDDDFSLGSRGPGRPPKSEKVDNRTLEFARLMGVDVSNKDTVERLKKYSSSDFNRFTPVND